MLWRIQLIAEVTMGMSRISLTDCASSLSPPPRQSDDAVPFSPVHRPPLKYSSDQACLPLLSTAFRNGYACGFVCYAAEVFYKAFFDATHVLYSAHPTLRHFRYAVAGAVAVGFFGGLPFGIQCCVMRGTEFTLEQLRGVRDILNLTVAGGLSFGALHFVSVEKLIAVAKKQQRYSGRFPLMAAVGATVGCFSHAAEFAFYDASTFARRGLSTLDKPSKEYRQGRLE